MSQPLKVAQLNAIVKDLLEGTFPQVTVEGEVSNLVIPASGHWYFTLKDETAQVRAVMFRPQQIDPPPQNGDHVIVTAQLTIYENRGDYQLIVARLTPSGIGLLYTQFLQLKQTLAVRGYFAIEHKISLPRFPKKIGLITSPTGAVICDLMNILNRRYPLAQLILYPVAVQGNGAAEQIAQMIQIANQRNEVDLLIIARGGGSLEDLWAFNEMPVIEAIFKSQLPIISAVGHETDFTIADFVADVRAPTPSAAAELAVPDQHELNEQIILLQERLRYALKRCIQHLRQELIHLAKRLRHPKEQLLVQRETLLNLMQRLKKAMQYRLMIWHTQFEQLQKALVAVSQTATLARGYALVIKNNKLVCSVKQVNNSDQLEVRLIDGVMHVAVQKTIAVDEK